VTLFVPGSKTVPWETLRDHYGLQQPLNIHWINENLALKRYDFAYKAVRMAERLPADLVYTWVLQAGVLCLWCGLPTVLELHDRVTGRLGPWLFRSFWASKTQQRVLTNTNALKNVLMAEFNLNPSEVDILVAPNGVDLQRYHDLPSPQDARQVLGLPDRFTAGYTGHFYAGRGMSLMCEMAQAMPDIHFLWVGGEVEDVTLWRRRLAAQGVKNITLTGFIDNAVLPKYQAACDVLLMPYSRQISGSGGGNSAEIASPMKMFEYMAAGRAIISSDLPVIHEVLSEQMAVFCPPDECSAWVRALADLRGNPGKRQDIGLAARQAVSAYTWQSRAEKALGGWIKNEKS
jgi:glycosyltransferase involved in cell wall biosynthesis